MKKREYKDKTKYKSRIRKQHTAATKSDALRSKEDVEISDEMINRMKHQISEMRGMECDVVIDNTLEKMSEVLLDYAEPLLKHIDPKDRTKYGNIIKMAIALWNYSILRDAMKDSEEVDKMLEPLMTDAETRSVVEYMLFRKKRLFPDNNRVIGNFELNEVSRGYQLSVASSMLKVKDQTID